MMTLGCRRHRTLWLSLALSLACLLDPFNVAHAAHEIEVCARGCDHTSIQAAIDGASPGDTILVAPGTYLENLDLYDRRVTIVGEDAATTIVSGANAGRVILLYANSTLTLSNITIRSGKVTDNQGGGIYNDGVLIINDSRIVDNRASVAGGGIANFGTLAINDTLISGNSAFMGNGGGIVNGGRLYVTASTIEGNYASGRGGGVYHSVGTFTLLRSVVADNRAAFGGGGVANFDFMSTAGSTIVANVTDGAGGGVLNGGHLTAVDLTLKANRADDGSSLYNSGTLVLGAVTVSPGSGSAECTSWGIVIPLLSPSKRGTLCGSVIPGK